MNGGFRDRGPGKEAPKKQGQHPGIPVAHSEEKNHEPNGQKRERIEADDLERGSLGGGQSPKGLRGGSRAQPKTQFNRLALSRALHRQPHLIARTTRVTIL